MAERPECPSGEVNDHEVNKPLSHDDQLLRSLRVQDVARREGRIKANALKPTKAADGKLSLIRHSSDESEAKAAAVMHVHTQGFWGFGSAKKGAIDPHVYAVTYTPHVFPGHVDVELGFEIPAGPPNTPAGMDEKYKIAMKNLIALAGEFRVHEDSTPESDTWGGQKI